MSKKTLFKSYQKLKDLIQILLKNEVTYKDKSEVINKDITEDNYRECITKLNKVKSIYSPSRGKHKIEDKYIDNSFLYDKNNNSIILASIIHLNSDENGEKVLNYLFQEAPKKFSFNFANKYNKRLNNDALKLVDNKKYNFLMRNVEINKEEIKYVTRIFNSKDNCYEKTVILQLFIYDSSWYICCYSIDKKVFEILNIDYISEIKLLNESYCNLIPEKKIETFIEEFINKTSSNHETILLRMTAQTLSLLLDFSLIKECKLFEEQKFEKDIRGFHGDISKYKNQNTNKISTKIMLKNIDLNSLPNEENKLEITVGEEIEFDYIDVERPKKFYVMTKMSLESLSYILNSYKDLEKVNINEVEIM